MELDLDKLDDAILAEDQSTTRREVSALYHKLLECWNNRSASEFAALFAAEGHIVGFDGSLVEGARQIAAHLAPIFASHPTPAYVAKVRGVRFLTPAVAVLSAVAGMVPRGQTDVNPALNAIQTLIALRQDGRWRIALFQNTPAAFHGRPEEAEALTRELRKVWQEQSGDQRAV